jgi:hypothetical protein
MEGDNSVGLAVWSKTGKRKNGKLKIKHCQWKGDRLQGWPTIR